MDKQEITKWNKELAKINTLGVKRLNALYEHFTERLAESNSPAQVFINESALNRILDQIIIKEKVT